VSTETCNLKAGDRVEVIHPSYRGLLGKVVGIGHRLSLPGELVANVEHDKGFNTDWRVRDLKLVEEGQPDRRKLTSTEVRVTSETGGAKGVKEARFDQIPTWPLWQVAVKFGKGNEKYPMTDDGLDNWRRGYEWSKSYAACMRHLTAFWSGEDIDEETGQLHLIAVAWHAMVMSEWWSREEMHKFDDRQDPRNPLEVKG
jgi:hypothetical protein